MRLYGDTAEEFARKYAGALREKSRWAEAEKAYQAKIAAIPQRPDPVDEAERDTRQEEAYRWMEERNRHYLHQTLDQAAIIRDYAEEHGEDVAAPWLIAAAGQVANERDG